MDAATVFEWGNRAALTGWLALLAGLFIPKFRSALFAWAGLILPAMLAVVYVLMLAAGMSGSDGGMPDFSSLAGVKALFSKDAAVTAGWLHYLAFDLFVGTWIARDGLERGAWRIALIPILALTFMFGPSGLLLYLALRATALKTKAPAAS